MLLIFFQALIISTVLFWLGGHFAKNNKRWGGIVLVIVFVGLVLVHRELEITRQLMGLLVGSVFILVFGWWDDWKKLSWRKQLFGQAILVGILIYFGFQVDYLNGVYNLGLNLNSVALAGVSILSTFFIFFWVVGIINAVNWLDGVDSSLGVTALFGGLSLVFVSFLPEVNQPAVAILASIFLGAVTGFLFFNLPPARVEAGTVGSYFIGFSLASLAIIAGSKIITMMIILVLPMVDFFLVIINRWQKGQSIFKRDKTHLHYQLRMLKWSDQKIFLVYGLFLGSVLLIYSWLPTREMRFWLLIIEILVVTVWIWLVRRRVDKS